MLTSRHKKAPESFDSEALDHDYYIWVKNGNLRKLKRGIYHKKLSSDEVEIRTAYEVSIGRIIEHESGSEKNLLGELQKVSE